MTDTNASLKAAIEAAVYFEMDIQPLVTAMPLRCRKALSEWIKIIEHRRRQHQALFNRLEKNAALATTKIGRQTFTKVIASYEPLIERGIIARARGPDHQDAAG